VECRKNWTKHRDKTRKGISFIRNPYKIASSVLDGKKSGRLSKKQIEVEAYLIEAHSNEIRKEGFWSEQ
jgi:hypothetical protein